MSDMLKETKKARSLLTKKQNQLRESAYESFMSGHGIKKAITAKKISKTISMINSSIEQQSSSGKVPIKHRSEQDAVKKDFIFSLHSKE